MICPKKFNSVTVDKMGIIWADACHCETTSCAWWNERFGMCCMAVDAHIKGVEVRIELEKLISHVMEVKNG